MRDESALRERLADYLGALQKELAGRVRALHLDAPAGAAPCLHVTARSGRTETVRVDSVDGRWWFFGPWDAPIGAADDAVATAARLLAALGWAELKKRLAPSLRSWPVRTGHGVGLRVDAGGPMQTDVTIADGRFWASIEPGTVPEPVGPVEDPDGAARRVSQMLGASR